MRSDRIPAWNAQGVIPPCCPDDPTSPDRSPYNMSLTDFVHQFGITQQRREILTGFLDFRAALHDAGLYKGFQWINGSYLENIEMLENRSPNDLDVVTFFHHSEGGNQDQLLITHRELFVPKNIKDKYRVDAYYVSLDDYPVSLLVEHTAYWYSLWSHRRDERWKGFIQIDLDSHDERVARARLQKVAE